MKSKTYNKILASVLINGVYAMKNMPIMLINVALQPLSFIIIIALVSHGALLGLAIEGAFIITVVAGGLALQGDLSHLKNDFKVQEIVVSSPTSAAMYLSGMALSELIYDTPELLILLVLSALFLHISMVAALAIVGVVVLMFILASAIGFVFSTLTSDVMQSWAFGGILALLFSTLTPVYYPITYIPMPWQYLVYLSPTTYAAQIAQSISGFVSISMTNFIIDWIMLIAITIILLLIAIYKSRWVER